MSSISKSKQSGAVHATVSQRDEYMGSLHFPTKNPKYLANNSELLSHILNSLTLLLREALPGSSFLQANHWLN
jgi:hypothetical protein